MSIRIGEVDGQKKCAPESPGALTQSRGEGTGDKGRGQLTGEQLRGMAEGIGFAHYFEIVQSRSRPSSRARQGYSATSPTQRVHADDVLGFSVHGFHLR